GGASAGGGASAAMAAAPRWRERLFALYFISHIPITALIDLQPLLPAGIAPRAVSGAGGRAGAQWFKAFIYCEAFLQLPFFPIAAYAFLKGGCRWIRTPAIIYSTHVATTLFAILAHILFHDFSKVEHAGPQTLRERLALLSIYLPYLLIPLLLLFTMLCNPHYKHVEKRKRK
ncbi:SGMR2 protein, partial [Pheucticus melanocephalus]|nr:SGMR2 protein [Pheucticus melanocephalus]